MNEPWSHDPSYGEGGVVKDKNDHPVALTHICGFELGISNELANRIVLCVNACAGMSDDLLRFLSVQKIKNLKSDLDEAVRLMEKIYDGEYSHGNNPAMLLAIRDFLTKHKEESSS